MFRRTDEGYGLEPRWRELDAPLPELWTAYSREEIPGLFGLNVPRNFLNQGFVATPHHIFLFVTLNKEDLPEEYRYQDGFLGPEVFQWESQRRTKQDSKTGRSIQNHRELEFAVQLFVRRDKKVAGRTQPFTYCGPVEFVRWEGEHPIRVEWKLAEPVPERLRERFSVDR
ncbi:MAG: DUF3427 domain-containing protein [Planctomycetota bacterium]|nr:DUF3427 domain-containing protein [Planctomycetota bacterium]